MPNICFYCFRQISMHNNIYKYTTFLDTIKTHNQKINIILSISYDLFYCFIVKFNIMHDNCAICL